MSPRSTLVLLVVVVLAGALVWWFEVRGAGEGAEREEAGQRIFQELEADAVEWIELRTRDGETARLERGEGGAWRLVEPIAYPADPLAADGIASALTEMGSERAFQEHEPLEAYGLEGEPEVRFGTGEARHALRLGDDTPIGSSRYVAQGDGETVYAVERWRTNALDKSLDELRDARVLDFDRDAVTALEVAWPGGRVRAERPEGVWRLTEPVETEADGEALESLLADLEFLRAEEFVDDPPPDAELGLGEPAVSIELFREGDEEPLRFTVGGTSEGETRAARGRGGRVYRIAAGRLQDFPRRVDAYRFKELADFDPSRAERVEIVFHPEAGGEPVRLEGSRGDDAGWHFSPEAMEPGAADAMLRALSHLEASGVAADRLGEEELAGLGLAPPRTRIRVLGAPPEDAEEAGEPPPAPVLADVSLGVRHPEHGIAARRADREEVFWLDPGVAEQVPLHLEAWRQRFVAEEEDGSESAGAGAEAGAGAGAEAADEGGAQGAAAEAAEGTGAGGAAQAP